MRNVYVVSHCQSIHHVEKLGGGWYDTGLTDLGRAQAEKTGMYLKSIIDSDVGIVSSDLKRAKETAEIIGEILGVDVSMDQGFREMRYGVIEGKPQECIRSVEVPILKDGERLDFRVYEGAESRREIGTRVKAALERAMRQEKDLVVVTHGFASTFVILSWLKIPVENMGYANFPSKPGCVTHLQEDDVYVNRGIRFLCYTGHLGG